MTFFYNLNKTLDAIREKPELKHGQLNERANSKPVEEGLGDVVRKVGGAVKSAAKKGLETLGHGSDEDMIRDLQKKAGVPQTGKKPQQPKEGVDKKAFAALAEPKDKITFADKIAGAKKEVDEMLGDVAAEAMKNALTGGQKKLDKNNNGKLDANDFAMLRKGAKSKEETDEGSTGDYSAKKARAGKDIGKPGKGFAKIAAKAGKKYGSKAAGERVAGAVLNKLRHPGEEEMEEGWDDMLKDVEKRRGAMKTGEKKKTSKGEVEKTSSGIRHTRSYDAKTGETDTGDDSESSGEKRGRGRPKGSKKAMGAKGPSGKSKLMTKEGHDEGVDMVKLAKVIQSCKTMDQLEAARKMAQNFLRKHSSGNDGVGFAGIGKDFRRRDAAVSDIARKKAELQGGVEEGSHYGNEKLANAKASRSGTRTVRDQDGKGGVKTTTTKTPAKKKEKTEEAGGTGTPTASSGFSFGKGIYDSMNHELETMIAESMSINLSSSTEGGKNITVTASDEDAIKLAAILKSAGLAGGDSEGYGGSGYQSACGCGTPDCSCGDEQVDENSPDWPTNTETSDDALQYAGGLNKPKSTGQTTVPVIASQEERQGTYAEAEEDAIKRMMEMAGIKEAKKVEEDDVEEGNKFTGNLAKARAAGKKEADLDGDGDMEKVRESVDQGILDATANLWTEYKGKYGV